jgi:hypothetical protein
MHSAPSRSAHRCSGSTICPVCRGTRWQTRYVVGALATGSVWMRYAPVASRPCQCVSTSAPDVEDVTV